MTLDSLAQTNCDPKTGELTMQAQPDRVGPHNADAARSGPISAPPPGVRYTAKGVLGVGGMGEVRLLKDELIKRDVAAKFLNPALRDRFSYPDLCSLFLREASLQARLEHPAIVPVYDLGMSEDGNPYFTMKNVRGMTLREILDGLRKEDAPVVAKYSRRKLLTAFNAVCLAVAYAHDHGMVHRDLKPSNIMLGGFGETYVLDWGIALEMGAPAPPPEFKIFNGKIGTAGYMAPEQVKGGDKVVSPALDIYALGSILFELLTLEPLHPGERQEAILRSTLSGVDARPSTRARGAEVPPELDEICVRATASDPRARFASVLEMSEALERFLDGERDLSLRLSLAEDQVRSAEAALDVRRDAAPELEEQCLGAALRGVGRALALVPDHVPAIRVLADLLRDPPRQLPREARDAVALAQQGRARMLSKKASTHTFLVALILMPLALWMGVREPWSAVVLLATSLLVIAGTRLWARSPQLDWLNYLLGAAIAIRGLVMARIFGPLFFPLTTFLSLFGVLGRRDRLMKAFIYGLNAVVIILPALMDVAGAGTSSYYRNVDGNLLITSHLLAFPPIPTFTFLLVHNIIIALVFLDSALGFGAQLDEMQSREQYRSWLLRQLVPRRVAGVELPRGGLAAEAR